MSREILRNEQLFVIEEGELARLHGKDASLITMKDRAGLNLTVIYNNGEFTVATTGEMSLTVHNGVASIVVKKAVPK